MRSLSRKARVIMSAAVCSAVFVGSSMAAMADSSVGTNISTSAGGTITSAGLLTGQAGATVTGAAVSLNASSNFNVNVATGTSTGTVTIGNATVSDVAINDAHWSVSGAGAAVFTSVASAAATALSVTTGTTGNLTLDSGTTGSVLIGTGVNAKTITIGNAADDTFSLNSSGLNVSSAGALTGVASIDTLTVSSTALTSAAATNFTLSTGTTGNLTLDSGTTGSVLIGTGVNAKTITIGNAADDTFSLNSSGLNVSSAGALTGVASIDTLTVSSTALTSAAATNFTLSTGTTGDLTLDSGTTGSVLIGTGVNAKTITIGNAADDTFSLNSSGLNVSSAGALTGVASIDTLTVSSTALTSAAATNFTLSTGTTGILTLDSGTTGAVNLGTGGNAKTVTIGNVTTSTAVNINTGTGGSLITTTGTGDFAVASGDTLLLDSGGVLELNSSGGAISIGNDTVNQNVNIGSAGIRTLTIGSTTGASAMLLKAGSGGTTVSGETIFDNTANVSYSAQVLTIADTGATTPEVATLTPASSFVRVDCQDVEGPACNVTLDETGARDGQQLQIVNTSATTVNIADSAGVSETSGAGLALGQYDSAVFVYSSDRWVQLSTSNN